VNGVAADSMGNTYVVGDTDSVDFPVEEPYDGTPGWIFGESSDAFVAKFDPAGTVEWATYFGGAGSDVGNAIALDPANNEVFIAGSTHSGWYDEDTFPIEPPHQAFNRWPGDELDGFVARFSNDGQTLRYSTLLNGSNDEEALALAVDSSGYAYVGGYTASWDFTNFTVSTADFATRAISSEAQGFVIKLDPTGRNATYGPHLLGGGGITEVWGLAVDGGGRAYAVGYTDVPLSTTGEPSACSAADDVDVFVTRLDGHGTTEYLRCIGGGDVEYATAVAVDTEGNAYVTGYTSSDDFLVTPGALREDAPGNGDAFVTKLAEDGEIVYSTYLGGSSHDVGNAIAVDSSKTAWIVGATSSEDFPTRFPLPNTQFHTPPVGAGEAGEAFITRLDASGSTIFFSTFYGGSDYDTATAIAVRSNGVHVAGRTLSQDLPNPIQGANAGLEDAFILTVTVPELVIDPSSVTLLVNGTQQFAAGGGVGFGYTYDVTQNQSGASIDSTGLYTAGSSPGIDIVTVTDPAGTSANATVVVEAPDLVIDPPTATVAPGEQLQFTASGGIGPYSFEITNNESGGTITSDGQYTAGPTGGVTDVVTVTDANGTTKTATVVVTAPNIVVTPSNATVNPRGQVQFTVSGGAAPYTFAITTNASGGTITSSGLYTAGSTGGVTDVVTVTDANGATANATVVVNSVVSANLTIDPPSASLPPRAQRQFNASGGTPPYKFSFASNASGGTLTSSGLYTAGSRGSVTDIVRVTDAAGSSAIATISVRPGITITPASPSAPPNGTINFSATGGSGSGYTWTITQNGSNGATIGASTGIYKAGSGSNTVDVVQVTDSLGNRASVQVSVGGGLAISPDAPTTSTRGRIEFSAFGGSGSYTWSLEANPSGGSIDPATGHYTAGSTGNVVDVVRVTDSVGNARSVDVTVGPSLAILPDARTVLTGAEIAFSGMGGSGEGYVWSIPDNQSGATIDPNGLYKAGEKAGTDTVRLTDSVGNTAEARVTVQARPAPGQTPGGVGSIDGGTFGNFAIGGGEDDCSCRAVGTSNGTSSARLIPALALAFGLVFRRRRR